MSSFQDRNRDLVRPDEAIAEQQLSVRLQELEAELQSPARDVKLFQPWRRKFIIAVQLFVAVVVVVAAVRVALWLASLLFVVVAGWIVYKLFFERNSRDR
jgi:Flp pilus assembly protein TadB